MWNFVGPSHRILIWSVRILLPKATDLRRKLPRTKSSQNWSKTTYKLFRGVLSNSLTLQKLRYLQNQKVARNAPKKFRRTPRAIPRTLHSKQLPRLVHTFRQKNHECTDENFATRAPPCKDQSEKSISEPHPPKVQTFTPPAKNVPGRRQTGKPPKTRLQKKKRSKKSRSFPKLNFFIINNSLDQLRIYHRRGQVSNPKNMSLSIFSPANSTSHTASKTGASPTPFWLLTG